MLCAGSSLAVSAACSKFPVPVDVTTTLEWTRWAYV